MDNVGIDSVSFVVAAYVATFMILAGYTVSLWRRIKRAGRDQTTGQKR